jgi:hypothetical protein
MPLWLLAIILSVFILGLGGYAFIKKMIERSKKYKMQVYTKTLPKKDERTLWLGKVAETNIPAFMTWTTSQLTQWCVGNRRRQINNSSVLIEGALMKNIAVIIFDQTPMVWDAKERTIDKKMISFYRNSD